MKILNQESIEAFLFKHRELGCIPIKNLKLQPTTSTTVVPPAITVNTHWKSIETGETIEIFYDN